MNNEELQKIYCSRPFKNRNADEYDLNNILDLFIDPTDGLNSPFEFSNTIIKGKMGSGKTMYLRANYAYYLHTIVPCLIAECPLILPVYIRLSDFQSIKDPKKIYESIIIKIIQEIVSVCAHLKSAEELARLHTGARKLPYSWPTGSQIKKVISNLEQISATEYVEKVSESFGSSATAAYKFLNLCADLEKTKINEIKKDRSPIFEDVISTCETLLTPFDGQLLLLFDEIGSTSKSFFKGDDDSESYFEILMNQLRTLHCVRTKLAVYPHSYSDILKETRYGDIIELECDIVNDDRQYDNFMLKTVMLIERYIEKSAGAKYKAEDLFDMKVSNQLIIEHLINASEGNMRRLVHLLDLSMNVGYERTHGHGKVIVDDVLNALKKQGAEMENLHQPTDVIFLSSLAKLCRARSTYRFTFPNKSSHISKFTSLSAEHNIIDIRQAGTGRQGTVYSFDYAYCIYKDLPTHYIKKSEKIDKSRSRSTGEPIKRIAQLSEQLLIQANNLERIEAKITYLTEDKGGFAMDEKNVNYFISPKNIIESDRKKPIYVGTKIAFTPTELGDNLIMACDIEILS